MEVTTGNVSSFAPNFFSSASMLDFFSPPIVRAPITCENNGVGPSRFDSCAARRRRQNDRSGGAGEETQNPLCNGWIRPHHAFPAPRSFRPRLRCDVLDDRTPDGEIQGVNFSHHNPAVNGMSFRAPVEPLVGIR